MLFWPTLCSKAPISKHCSLQVLLPRAYTLMCISAMPAAMHCAAHDRRHLVLLDHELCIRILQDALPQPEFQHGEIGRRGCFQKLLHQLRGLKVSCTPGTRPIAFCAPQAPIIAVQTSAATSKRQPGVPVTAADLWCKRFSSPAPRNFLAAASPAREATRCRDVSGFWQWYHSVCSSSKLRAPHRPWLAHHILPVVSLQ